MANSPNFNWELPDDTDLVKDGASAMRTLGNAIDSSLVDLKGGTTGQVLSKASNTDLDFTWVAQDDSNAIQNAIVDAKGDLITATAADTPARLAVGSNDQVLMADSSTATGLKWGTPSSGGYTLISEQTVSAQTSLSFSSIPSSYKHLLLAWNGIQHSATGAGYDLRFNNNSSTIYIRAAIGMLGGSFDGSNTESNSASSGGNGRFLFGDDVYKATMTQRDFCFGWIFIENYASTTRTKNYQGWASYNDANLDFVSVGIQGYFNSTSAISSLDIVRLYGSATFSTTTNSSIRLYGVS